MKARSGPAHCRVGAVERPDMVLSEPVDQSEAIPTGVYQKRGIVTIGTNDLEQLAHGPVKCRHLKKVEARKLQPFWLLIPKEWLSDGICILYHSTIPPARRSCAYR